jgi:DNA-binding YbaB/EbfC family protein
MPQDPDETQVPGVPDLSGLPDLDVPGVPDLGGLLAQAMQMQQEVMAAQAAAAEEVVEGQSGGGAVTVEVTGGMEFRSVRISPAAVDPDDVELLQDLVLAAVRDAMARVQDLQARSMGSVGGMGDLLGGGGLGGLLGGGPDPLDDGRG